MKAGSIALLAGWVVCALIQQAPAAERGKYEEKVLYSFCPQGCASSGSEPTLTDVKGTLYGTTEWGGAHSSDFVGGTVFSINPKTGAETTIYSFCGRANCADGSLPVGGVIDVNGILYGTTISGGGTGCFGDGCGTVFSLNPITGKETVLHSFAGGPDGANPYAGLVDVKGTLYGTTEKGGGNSCGGYGCGTVFSLDPRSGEKQLFSFQCGDACTHGAYPYATLIAANGVLYGTTAYGGNPGPGCDGDGCGTVFSFDPEANFLKTLYTFCSQANCTDGTIPEGRLIYVDGVLYGTTVAGGDGEGCDRYSFYGCGTLFSVDPYTGAEKVLYSFCSNPHTYLNGACTDGYEPQASLIDVKGILYGTTEYGGPSVREGAGTVFAVNLKNGNEQLLYSFTCPKTCPDGAIPGADLIDIKGTLYGTTSYGGGYDGGEVFVLKAVRRESKGGDSEGRP